MLFPAFQPQTTGQIKKVTSSDRTRISYFTSLTSATYVVLPKENHMQLTEAATLDRKSGEAEGSAVSLNPEPTPWPSAVFKKTRSKSMAKKRKLLLGMNALYQGTTSVVPKRP